MPSPDPNLVEIVFALALTVVIMGAAFGVFAVLWVFEKVTEVITRDATD